MVFKVDGLARLLKGHHILSFGNMVYEISRWNNDEPICIFFTQSKKNLGVHWIGQHCGNKRSMDFEEH